MSSWIVRLSIIAAGAVTSWGVAKDAPEFGAIQAMAALLLLTFSMDVPAFRPSD